MALVFAHATIDGIRVAKVIGTRNGKFAKLGAHKGRIGEQSVEVVCELFGALR
jgi:hypothetical protein